MYAPHRPRDGGTPHQAARRGHSLVRVASRFDFGELQVHSAPGEGTSVLIRVPLLPALAPVKKPRARRRV